MIYKNLKYPDDRYQINMAPSKYKKHVFKKYKNLTSAEYKTQNALGLCTPDMHLYMCAKANKRKYIWSILIVTILWHMLYTLLKLPELNTDVISVRWVLYTFICLILIGILQIKYGTFTDTVYDKLNVFPDYF